VTSGPAPPYDLIRPQRAITAMSAVLLPFTDSGAPDLATLDLLVRRTVEHGLVPALNMDTGFGNLLTPEQRREVLEVGRSVVAGGMLVAGAWVDDEPGASFDRDLQGRALDEVMAYGAVPVSFPNHGLKGLAEGDVVEAHQWIGARCDRFIAFELGEVFSPAGRIWDLETYRGVMAVPSCIGAKHSSLHREPEWARLRLRDAERPDFLVLTGNDLAIDMVTYGSDYLLGLSAFAPDLFARRDAAWAAGLSEFHELNDDLQALGSFAFRSPVPAYKHDAARFLHLRGWIPTSSVHPAAATRADSDDEVLRALLARLERWA